MATVAELSARITADTSNFEAGVNRSNSMIEDFSKKLGVLGSAVSAAFGAGIIKIGEIGISFDRLKEQATTAFTSLLHSGEEAQVFLNKLQRFAVETPFEFKDL